MDDPRYILEIEELLSNIAELERSLSTSNCLKSRQQIQKCLKSKEKRLDHLTPFRYKLYLRNICNELQIKTAFI